MELEFDHFFVCTTVGAPEVGAVLEIGLTEGTANSHSGQGTANRRIFFHNAMVEFLWVVDDREVRHPQIAPTHLWERWHHHQTNYSPFGIGFRRCAKDVLSSIPFATWAYQPPYLPPPLQIDVARHTTAVEPLLFVIPYGGRPDTLPLDRQQPLHHATGWREITRLHITVPTDQPFSTAIHAIAEMGLITFSQGQEHFAEIEWDGGTQGKAIDVRPTLPLGFRW